MGALPDTRPPWPTRSKGVTLDDENRGRYLIGSEIGVFFLVTLRAGEVAALPA